MIFTPTMTGMATPSPLQFAFVAKHTPHAGRRGAPLALDEPQWQERWQQASTAARRALYLHIPFCRKRCSFCNFFENGANPARMEAYVTALCGEIKRRADTPFAQSRPFGAVYLGGGTPTDMTADQIGRLLEVVRRFPLAPDAEVTLEGRLNGFDDEKWQAALEGGVNRFSFGVQSFDSRVRLAAGRLDEREALLARLQTLSERDSAVVVADLIFGLPWQSHASWAQDLDDLLASRVHGVDLYQLIGLPGNNLERFNASGRQPEGLPSAERALMYRCGAERLEEAGWERLSCCHWRRDGRERSRYNRLAKSGAEILPFGAGAGGVFQGMRVMNGRDLNAWHQALSAGVPVPAMMMGQGPNDAWLGRVSGALDQGLLPWTILPEPWRAPLATLFIRWQEHGLARVGEEGVSLTLAGRFWTVNLQAGLLEFLDANPEAAFGEAG
ncbi:putative heme utilization radical SAM enzyme HutW [Aeromonas schubertii]|uniref:heme anaerobic degradation radical SAM methyltransferase ChuW/HutW n=1 Tax=Aeromonas schubertii TaxID=652 RepID=UPI00067EAB10|nr:heme anaerobic degradation radical SAM methyltransferase ChuW/HutW [Aeromonas schubertii]KUE78956.1 putative heme utilization radical SAM enzyme HutW [Aeromonas schubertii]